MMLGAIDLDDNIILAGEFAYPAAGQSVRRTILGRAVIQWAPVSGGRELVLEATDEGGRYKGFFTRSQVEQIKALEAAQDVVTLDTGAATYDVVVKAGGVDVRPVIDLADPDAADHYVGTVTLIEV